MKPDDPTPSPNEPHAEIATEMDDPLDSIGISDRLWLRTILQIIQASTNESHPNPRVQFALDRVQIAACERAMRVLSSDLTPPLA